jgi:integration host factor subunit alpha
MRKADIAEIITETAGIQKTESMEMVEQVLDLIKAMMQQGEVVKIAGFGNFVKQRGTQRTKSADWRGNCHYPSSGGDFPSERPL